jgi:2-desacetyl-2-hydroxyethyl bacteriochlorophyllide A dehydrogenase
MTAATAQELRPASQIVFLAKQWVALEPDRPGPTGSTQVRVRTTCSLMSTGTENIVFNGSYEPGSHWDRWVRWPMPPGYAAIGTVESVGAEVKSVRLGELVAVRRSHRSHHVVDASACVSVPDGIDPTQAAWFALAKIGFMGARAAAYQLGDTVVVIGAGPIGQMSIRWARALGVQHIIAVDRNAKRLDLARAGGATTTIAKRIADGRREIAAANKGQQPRVVIDATGNADVLPTALGIIARRGTVVLLGDTGSPSQQRLTYDVVTRGVTIVGAHGSLEDERWTAASISEYFFDLVAQKRFSLEGLNTHTFKPQDCSMAYEVANTRRGETMGILFDWT